MADDTRIERPERNEIASARNDLTAPVWGKVLSPRDETLLTRGGARGLAIYDDIGRDCHAWAVLQKRKMAVVARPLVIEAASEDAADKRAAEVVREQLTAMDFDRACLDMMDAILMGFSVGEVMWDVVGREIVATEIRPRDPRRFTFDLDGMLRLLTVAHPVEGIEVPGRKFVVQRFGGRDNPFGLGLGSRLFWPVLFKRQGIAFWLVFAEKFGSPTAVGKYPEGTSAEKQDKLLESLKRIAQETAIVAPIGTEVELLEAARSGTIATYEGLCRYMDGEISKAVLGETLSTDIGDTGSRAASQTHNEVREELTDADADLQNGTLSRSLVKWIVDYNVPGARPPSLKRVVPEDEAASEDLRGKRATRIYTLRTAGIRVTDFDTFPEAVEEGWEHFDPADLPAPSPSFAAPPVSTVADELAEQAETFASDITDGWIDAIRDLAGKCETLEDFRDRLLDLYPGMNAGTLGDLIAGAFATAELTGMAEVADDAG